MTQESPQKLNVRYEGGVTIVSFSSPYLQSESVIERVGAELAELAGEQGHTKMLVSLGGVRFVSSSMLAQLVKLQKVLTKSKGRLRVCSLTPQLREVLRVSQLDKMLDVHDTEEAALAKF
jgi:anti-sigma B factor antagonist